MVGCCVRVPIRLATARAGFVPRMGHTAGPDSSSPSPTGMLRPPRANDEYRPTSKRQRLVILALAVGTAVTVMVAMLSPHVRFLRADKASKSQDAPACTRLQTQGCVGGTMGVISAPALAASAGR